GAACTRDAKASTRTRIHGGNELKICWVSDGSFGTGDRHLLRFERSTECFYRGSSKLRELIKKKHSAVSEARLAGAKLGSAPHKSDVGRNVVWRSKGAPTGENLFHG